MTQGPGNHKSGHLPIRENTPSQIFAHTIGKPTVTGASVKTYLCADLQARAKGGRGFGHVFFAEFSESGDNSLRIVSGGANHIKFWTLYGRCFICICT